MELWGFDSGEPGRDIIGRGCVPLQGRVPEIAAAAAAAAATISAALLVGGLRFGESLGVIIAAGSDDGIGESCEGPEAVGEDWKHYELVSSLGRGPEDSPGTLF
eukprot:GHVO01035051.1.p1 GENE.GHVO01035051.1~~GHVO01035051.1.p1  ORF type:complete len:104 (-),score=13.77 GHVO01035051.1:498-809(-)